MVLLPPTWRALCLDLNIAELINNAIGVHDKRIVSPGHAVVAMILNGLGFTDRRLYLTSQFFESKPVSELLNADVKASDLNDYTLAHTLDEISNFGTTELFGTVAFNIALENNLLGHLSHIDSTSISVSGEYLQEAAAEGEPIALQITHGHSKDHRPDLQQVVLSLVANGPSHMPIWMEAQNGNSSDKKTFHETIKRVNAFKKQLDAKALVFLPEKDIAWNNLDEGPKCLSYHSNYGGITQRWLLIYSEKAYQREKKTCEKNWMKAEEEIKKVIWHLGNEVFGCIPDAENKVVELRKNYADFHFSSEIVPVTKYSAKGKPKEREVPSVIGFKVNVIAVLNEEKREEKLNRKGRFILATNELDVENYSDEKMLSEYKEQQHVERGFRFLKDPWFMVDSIFLKSTKRIEALMMVMTLCLLVYNIGQYRLRKKLVEEKETIPNQLGKGPSEKGYRIQQ